MANSLIWSSVTWETAFMCVLFHDYYMSTSAQLEGSETTSVSSADPIIPTCPLNSHFCSGQMVEFISPGWSFPRPDCIGTFHEVAHAGLPAQAANSVLEAYGGRGGGGRLVGGERTAPFTLTWSLKLQSGSFGFVLSLQGLWCLGSLDLKWGSESCAKE